MPAPIHSQLADEIGVSSEKAEKLLRAMLREVHKRARQRGVRLPDLGKFSEQNGELVFEPSDSLARAVNHRFEGLDSEDLASAPKTEPEDEEDDQGPSTITLGYQESSRWSPIDDSDESDTTPEEEDADTEEFEVPSADDAADTQELKASEDRETTPGSERGSSVDPSPSTESASGNEDLYPLVEDASEDESEPVSASNNSDDTDGEKDQHEALSDIWESDEDESEPQHSSEPESPPSFSAFDQSRRSEFTDASETSTAPTEESVSEPEMTPDRSTQDGTRAEPRNRRSSGGARVLVTLLVILLLGGAAWYVLGQQGTLPQPRTTFAQLKAQIQPHVENLPLVGSNAQRQSTSASSEDSTGVQTDGRPSSSTEPASQSTEERTEAAGTPGGATEKTIDRSAGGWTIVVASRTDPVAAQNLLESYRQRFADRNVPLDVIQGNVNNTTRYRVGVGQFTTRQDALTFIENAGAELPNGAWALQLQ